MADMLKIKDTIIAQEMADMFKIKDTIFAQ